MNHKQKLFLLAEFLISSLIACSLFTLAAPEPTPNPSATPSATPMPFTATPSPILPTDFSRAATQTATPQPTIASSYTYFPLIEKPPDVQPEAASQPVEGELNLNANCLTGPGNPYSIITVLHADEKYIIDGRSADSSWWHIQIPDLSTSCWVPASSLTVAGDPTALPFLQAPPTPTQTLQPGPAKTATNTVIVQAPVTPSMTHTVIVPAPVTPSMTHTVAIPPSVFTSTPTHTDTVIIPPTVTPTLFQTQTETPIINTSVTVVPSPETPEPEPEPVKTEPVEP